MNTRALLLASLTAFSLAACSSSSKVQSDATPETESTSRTTPASATEPSAALPDPGQTLELVAFGSCNDQERSQAFWDVIAKKDPQVFVYGGDNVYGDIRMEDGKKVYLDGDMERLAQTYATLGSAPEFQRFRAAVPIVPIWDDHDYGKNDAGGEFAKRLEAEAQFLEFWEVGPQDPRRTRDGLYHAWTWGEEGKRAQLVVLDTRSFRSPLKPTDVKGAPGKERYLPDPDPAKTMLGEAQWSWLEEQLAQPADVRLVVSTIQVVAEGHGWERWGNLPAEREKLYRTLDDSGARNIVLLSGDRHSAGIYAYTLASGAVIHELTSSSLNLSLGEATEPGPHRLHGLYAPENFATIALDWEGRSVALRVHDAQGETALEHVLRMD